MQVGEYTFDIYVLILFQFDLKWVIYLTDKNALMAQISKCAPDDKVELENTQISQLQMKNIKGSLQIRTMDSIS